MIPVFGQDFDFTDIAQTAPINPFSGCLCYAGVVTQSGTDAPTIVFSAPNTLGPAAWQRLGVGNYALNLPDAFPVGRTLVFASSAFPADAGVYLISPDSIVGAPDSVRFQAFDIDADGKLLPVDPNDPFMSLLILVFPTF